MPKISEYPSDSAPDPADIVPIVDVSAGATEKVTVADLAASSAFAAQYATVVEHGATAGTARPSTTGVVIWIGTVTPTNAEASDLVFVSAGTTTFDQAVRSSGDITATTSWADIGGTSVTVQCAEGDVVAFMPAGKWNNDGSADAFLDVYSVNRAAKCSASTFGYAGWSGANGVRTVFGGVIHYTLQASDVDAGEATFNLQCRVNSSTRTLKADTDEQLYFAVQVL